MAFSSRFAFWEQKESWISKSLHFSCVLGMVYADSRLACERGSFGSSRWNAACVCIWGPTRMTKGPVSSLFSLDGLLLLSHAPPLSSTSSKLSCLLSHWCPSELTLPQPSHTPLPTHPHLCCFNSPLEMWATVEVPLGMTLALRSRNWVSSSLVGCRR